MNVNRMKVSMLNKHIKITGQRSLITETPKLRRRSRPFAVVDCRGEERAQESCDLDEPFHASAYGSTERLSTTLPRALRSAIARSAPRASANGYASTGGSASIRVRHTPIRC